MEANIVKGILDVQDKALADGAYQELYAQYEVCSGRFLELLNALPEQQRAVLEDFLGVSAAMHLRLLELAVQTQS